MAIGKCRSGILGFIFNIGLMILSTHVVFAQEHRRIFPIETDAAIDTFNYYHEVYFSPEITQLGKLFVFFPGTGGTPVGYLDILETAANMGYHSIGLCYQNPVAVNAICGTSSDPDCHMKMRGEIYWGEDLSDEIVVTSPNGIRNRLIKLLQHLAMLYPSENWGQFLTPNDTLVWNNYALGGHSQGGGHAGFLGYHFETDRVIIIAGGDGSVAAGGPAQWVSNQGATQPHKVFGFTHIQDDLVKIENSRKFWTALGLDSFGPETDVDNSSSPYNGSHKLTTQLSPDNDPNNYHGSPVVITVTPRDMNGNPLYEPVWEYMLSWTPVAIQERVGAQGYYIQWMQDDKVCIQNTQGVAINWIIFNAMGQQIGTTQPTPFWCSVNRQPFHFKVVSDRVVHIILPSTIP